MANRMDRNPSATQRFNLKSIVETLKRLVSCSKLLRSKPMGPLVWDTVLKLPTAGGDGKFPSTGQ